MNRREALQTLGALALVELGSSCSEAPDGGTQDAGDAGAGCSPAPALPADGWIEVPLASYPALRKKGTGVAVRIPEALLDVILIHTQEGCYLATWSICPHGACTVDYVPEQRELHCPCHGSRFAEDGQLLGGPAPRALKSFAAAQVGESIWIHRKA